MGCERRAEPFPMQVSQRALLNCNFLWWNFGTPLSKNETSPKAAQIMKGAT